MFLHSNAMTVLDVNQDPYRARLRAVRAGDIKNCKSRVCSVSDVAHIASFHHFCFLIS